MVYDWTKGYRPKVKAQVAGEALEAIEQKHGELTSKIVLEESRAVDAPLHPCFEWDDAIAAELYRLRQASSLIRSLVVVCEQEDRVTESPAFVNVMPVIQTTPASYRGWEVAMNTDEMREQVLANALRELKIFRARYENLAELAGVMAAIDEFATSRPN